MAMLDVMSGITTIEEQSNQVGRSQVS
jgi:hypothetical protein